MKARMAHSLFLIVYILPFLPAQESPDLLRAAQIHYDSLQFEQCLEKAEWALSQVKSKELPDSGQIAESYRLKGFAQLKLAKFQQARVSINQGLQYCPFGDYDQQVALLLGQINVAIRLRDLSAAEKVIKKGSDISRRYLGKDHRQTLMIRGREGLLLIYRGQLAAAKILLLDLIEECEARRELDELRSGLYNNLAAIYNWQSQLDSAGYYYEKSAALMEIGNLHQKSTLRAVYTNLISIRRVKGDYKAALHFGEMALESHYRYVNKEDPWLEGSLVNYANVLQEIGRKKEALDYYEKALRISEEVFGKNHIDAVSMHNAIGRHYEDQGDYDKALFSFRRSLAIKKANPGDEYSRIWTVQSGIAKALISKGDYEQALVLIRKNVAELSRELGALHEDVGANYHLLGMTYQHLERYQEAEAAYKKQVESYRHTFGENAPRTSAALRALAHIYTLQGHFAKAEKTYQEVLQIIGEPTSGETLNFHKWEAYLANLRYWQQFYIQRYKQQKTEADLDQALLIQDKIFKGFDDWQKVLEEKKSKEIVAQIMNPVIEQSLWASYTRYRQSGQSVYLDNAFQLAERGKNFTLLESLRNTKAKSFAGVPDSLIRKEEQLKAKIAQLQTQLFQLEGKDSKEEEAKVLENDLFDQGKQLSQLLNDIAHQYPAYFRLKESGIDFPLKAVQQNLIKPSQLLIEYFLGEEQLYIFVLSSQKADLIVKDLPDNFSQLIFDLRKNIKNVASFEKEATALYTILLKDPLEKFAASADQLLIVPDGILGYLPFEVLPLKTEQSQETSYLIEKYRVAYAYSATLLREQQKPKIRSGEKIFAGFAPSYQEVTGAGKKAKEISMLVRAQGFDLPGAVAEVEAIARLLEGVSYINAAASETVFKQSAKDFRILHLAMHSILEEDNPLFSKLLFSTTSGDTLEDNQLHTIELYNMQLRADLAVLSACNTGYGKIQRGEGIQSIGRAFSYAGVPATIMSLWKVPDEATSRMMVDLYQNLKKGQRKDEALRRAKLAWLQSDEISQKQKHPYYWAGFIAAGNMEPIDLSTSHQWWWILGFGVLFVLYFFLRNKKK